MFNKQDPKTLQLVKSLDCSTEQLTEIQSYGDFEFTLRKIGIDESAYSVDTAIYYMFYDKRKMYSDSDFDFDMKSEKYPQYKNAKEAFDEINVFIKCSEEEFRERYGFWELQDFIVYERDGNQSTCSFKSGENYYYGKYDTW